jgi:HK97 family phage portal protein
VGLRDNLLASLDRFGQRWVADQRAITPTQLFGTGLDDWYAGNTSAGIQVTAEAAMRAAQGACIGLIADDIASLPVDFYMELAEAKVPMPEEPGWYDQPGTSRWDTWPDHISQVVISLLSDGNAFVQGIPDTMSPAILDVLDPGTVAVRKENGAKQYVVQGAQAPYGDAEIMHIPWRRMPGKLRGLNPVESAKETTGLELAAREWASRFFSNGATLGGLIQVPAGVPMTKDGIAALREQFANQHVGKRKAFAFGVLTGGAEWIQNTVTPQDSALAPLWRQVLEEAARIYHIPPHLLASQESGASSYASVEHRSIEYVQHAIVPVVRRLEVAYSRLVPGPETYLKFNVNALLRGDIKTRAEAYSFFLQNKVLQPSYVAQLEDFPPDQAAPGWLETPNNNGPRDAAPAEPPAVRSIPTPEDDVATTINVYQPDMAQAADRMAAFVEAAEQRAAAAEQRAIAAEERIAALVAQGPVVNVTVPEAPAPVINNHVRVLPAEAPVVNVPAVQDIRIVALPPVRATARKNRDGSTTISEE